LRGFLVENYDGTAISITRSYWRGHELKPKTRKSKAPVPIIAPLAKRLNLHLELMGSPKTGLMFKSSANNPINLDAMVRDVIKPALRSSSSSRPSAIFFKKQFSGFAFGSGEQK
jgi:hypothetical protein